MNKIPVILDTDIGGDIDDTWALALLLKSPELDVKLVTSATADTVYRAKILAKFLEMSGRSGIPIGIGLRQASDGPRERQAKWVEGYDLDKYPGKIHQDGVGAMIECVRASREPVTLISIGPLPNVAEALARAGDIAGRTDFVGMHGSFAKHHRTNLRLSMEDGAIPEWNVVCDIKSAQRVFSAKWRSFTITPLDTCAWVALDGELYARCRDSVDRMMKMVMQNYWIWSPRNDESDPSRHSSVLHDVVAVYLAFARKWIKMEKMRISVDGNGCTVRDENGIQADVAIAWENLAAFKKWLVERLVCAA